MSLELTKLEDSKVELKFKINSEVFAKAVDEAFKQNAGKFKIQGFRDGKAPRAVIEKMYGEGIMYDDAFNSIAEVEYDKAIKEHGLNIVSKPEVNIISIGKNVDLEYTITVYVKPEDVKISKYIGLEIEKVSTDVTDEDINNKLEEIRNKNARLVTKSDDSAIENGDTACIDYKGLLDGVAFDGGMATNYDLEIGSHSFIPGFEEQLIGMKKDEERDINVTFPEQYGAKDLAGKAVIFKIKVHDIKKKELPELNDEFAKDVSEFDTLADYKASVTADLVKAKAQTAKMDIEQKVIEELLKNVEVTIPEPMIEHQVEHIKEDFEQRLMYQGMDMKQYLQILNQNEEELLKSFREPAIRDIKLDLAIEQIIKTENIEVSDEQIKEKIEELAKQYEKNSAEFMNNENVKAYVKQNLKHEKVFEIITTSAMQK